MQTPISSPTPLLPTRLGNISLCGPTALHGDDIEHTFFNGDTSAPNLGCGTVNATVAEVLQDYAVNFAESGKPGRKGVPAFPTYGRGKGKVLDLNVTGPGSVLADANDNARRKYWQEAAWM